MMNKQGLLNAVCAGEITPLDQFEMTMACLMAIHEIKGGSPNLEHIKDSLHPLGELFQKLKINIFTPDDIHYVKIVPSANIEAVSVPNFLISLAPIVRQEVVELDTILSLAKSCIVRRGEGLVIDIGYIEDLKDTPDLEENEGPPSSGSPLFSTDPSSCPTPGKN